LPRNVCFTRFPPYWRARQAIALPLHRRRPLLATPPDKAGAIAPLVQLGPSGVGHPRCRVEGKQPGGPGWFCIRQRPFGRGESAVDDTINPAVAEKASHKKRKSLYVLALLHVAVTLLECTRSAVQQHRKMVQENSMQR
jgi:hypothetical protein